MAWCASLFPPSPKVVGIMDIQERLADLNEKIDKLMIVYQSEGVPPPPTYRLGDNEFIFRVVQLVITDQVKALTGLDEDEWDVLIKEKWLEQAERMLENTKKSRLEAQAAAAIAMPNKPKMFLPPGMQT